ncbi:hypothetical protein N7466_007193 [Penicillium verhagenii]|uniref:uncharacterized protein n=1 Tax=Penicillium verhagenii TaxID=1562060 RepID=UPI0025455C19|nr:uncharacterized protein N7466_007193 [Penicillium verhagenii]KAJ5928237.1 hypothetical protein N7466_007193 [Penicillium verhagenii]
MPGITQHPMFQWYYKKSKFEMKLPDLKRGASWTLMATLELTLHESQPDGLYVIYDQERYCRAPACTNSPSMQLQAVQVMTPRTLQLFETCTEETGVDPHVQKRGQVIEALNLAV